MGYAVKVLEKRLGEINEVIAIMAKNKGCYDSSDYKNLYRKKKDIERAIYTINSFTKKGGNKKYTAEEIICLL